MILNDNAEKCENCKHFHELTIMQRRVEELGYRNVVTGWRIGKGIETNKSRFDITACCTLFLNDGGGVHETVAHDRCEMWEQKEDKKDHLTNK